MSTLYDFLFVDQERMRSLYAQLYEGLLDAMSFESSSSNAKGHELQAGGDPFGHASRHNTEGLTESKNEGLVPHDLVLRDVLSCLTERNMIIRSHAELKVGSIALVQGSLSVLDTRNLLNFLNKFPELLMIDENAAFGENVGKSTRKHAREKNSTEKRLNEAILSMIAPLIQLRIDADDFEVWAAIREDSVRGSIDNLVMQHGAYIPGKWNVLGIVDDLGLSAEAGSHREFPEIFAGLTEAMESVKAVFQRPEGAICLTPLVVFRTISPE